jgi:hypothetical protein
VAIGFEHQLQRVSIVLIVVDDEDTREIRCHELLELFHLITFRKKSELANVINKAMETH